MKVILAGYNIDRTCLEEMNLDNKSIITPETISAAYARISRDSRPVDELRKIAKEDVEKARRSNRTIIFEMGHASIAEHAVFNFDLIGLSRLAVEEVQSHRLNSYTEKSQRYIRLNQDYIVPVEVEKCGLKQEFDGMVKRQFEIYELLLEKLLPYFRDKLKPSDCDRKEIQRIEGLAKEDARYALPMAITSQMGMTINARNLEYMIRRLAETKLEETRRLGKLLAEHAKEVAPSLIRYVEPQEYKIDSSILFDEVDLIQQKNVEYNYGDDVVLIDSAPEAEEKVLAAILFHKYRDWQFSIAAARGMNQQERYLLFKERLAKIRKWDPLPREFEMAEFAFELTVSSSCFAQIKRHRMATIITSTYNPTLGITIPESIKSIKSEGELEESFNSGVSLYNRISGEFPAAAAYTLTNASRRKVLLKMNARELYHFSRLREDEHAQWDIRSIAASIMKILREKYPVLFLLTCGKHEFKKKYEEVYGY